MKPAIIFAVVASLALGQTIVDQGKPGTKGPWPVTGSVPVFIVDGGVTNGGAFATYPYHCANASPYSIKACDGGVQTITGITDGGSRIYIVVTNLGDDLGAGTSVIKCRPDGVLPSLTAGTAGWLGSVGGSIQWTNSVGAPVKCACTSGWVGGFECAP